MKREREREREREMYVCLDFEIGFQQNVFMMHAFMVQCVGLTTILKAMLLAYYNPPYIHTHAHILVVKCFIKKKNRKLGN